MPNGNKRTLIEKCGRLTNLELNELAMHLWPSEGTKTVIPYTFDNSRFSETLKPSHLSNYKNTKFYTLDSFSISSITNVLGKWTTACSNQVTFKHIVKPNKYFKGIIFKACQFDPKYRALGMSSSYFRKETDALVRGFPRETLNIICLPTIKKSIDIHVASHEIGHALGLDHFHDVESLKNRLTYTSEGLGCSVMPYKHLLRSAYPTINTCHNSTVCLNENFAVYPGPLDAKACTSLYDLKNPFIYKAPFPNHFSNHLLETGIMLGILSGIKGSLKTFLVNKDTSPLKTIIITNAFLSSALLLLFLINTHIKEPSPQEENILYFKQLTLNFALSILIDIAEKALDSVTTKGSKISPYTTGARCVASMGFFAYQASTSPEKVMGKMIGASFINHLQTP